MDELEKLKRQAAKRIQFIVDEYCDGKQQELADKAGITKASISQYVHGKNVPTNITAKKIGAPFSINPAWIMGFDVPMNEVYEVTEDTDTGEITLIVEKYRELNDHTRRILCQYIDFLLADPKNRKNN